VISAGFPAYLNLQVHFQVSAGFMKFTMAVTFLIFAISQLFWGVLSDRFGRKPVFVVATSLAVLGSMINFSYDSVNAFVVGRCLEAFGIGFAPVMARSILGDVLELRLFQISMSYVVMVGSLMHAIALIIGGYLIVVFSFQIICLFLIGFGLIMLCLSAFFIKETHHAKSQSLDLVESIRGFGVFFHDWSFVAYLSVYVLMFSSLFTFYSIAQYIYIGSFNILPNFYGYLLLLISLSSIIGSFCSNWLIDRLDGPSIIQLGLKISGVAVSILLIFWLGSLLTAFTVTVSVAVYALGCGLIFPTANACAIANFSQGIGSASSLFGSGVILCSSLLTGVCSVLPYPMIVLMPFMYNTRAIQSIDQPIRTKRTDNTRQGN